MPQAAGSTNAKRQLHQHQHVQPQVVRKFAKQTSTRRNPMHPLHRAQQVRSTRVMAVTDHEAGVDPNEAAGPTLAHHESFTTHPPHERTTMSRWHVAPSPCIPQRVPRTRSRQLGSTTFVVHAGEHSCTWHAATTRAGHPIAQAVPVIMRVENKRRRKDKPRVGLVRYTRTHTSVGGPPPL